MQMSTLGAVGFSHPSPLDICKSDPGNTRGALHLRDLERRTPPALARALTQGHDLPKGFPSSLLGDLASEPQFTSLCNGPRPIAT